MPVSQEECRVFDTTRQRSDYCNVGLREGGRDA